MEVVGPIELLDVIDCLAPDLVRIADTLVAYGSCLFDNDHEQRGCEWAVINARENGSRGKIEAGVFESTKFRHSLRFRRRR